MHHADIIHELARNKEVFAQLLSYKSEKAYRWKPTTEQWCLLEIICHLLDEEREDFRSRIQHLFDHPNTPPPPFDPKVWVTERKYMEQNYEEKLQSFLKEREASLQWLKSLENPAWGNAYQLPEVGERTAAHFLVNWLAHDYLHIRQIVRTNYQYLQASSDDSLDYAGKW